MNRSFEHLREFAERLQRELPAWQSEGVVARCTARRIAARYGIEAPPSPADRERTGVLAAAAGLAVALALAIALLASGIGDGVVLPLTALAAAFTAAPLAVRGEACAPAAAVLRVEGRILFYVAAYALSFVTFAEATRFRSGLVSQGLLAAVPPLFAAITGVGAGFRRHDVDVHTRGEAMLLVATVVAFAVGLSLDTGDGTSLIATMALAFLAVGRIVRGLSWGSRGSFVEGIVVATLLVAGRAFAIFPSAWIAVSTAVACFAAAIAAVIGFERRRARRPDDLELS